MIKKQTIPSKIEEIIYWWVKNNKERIKEIEEIVKNYKPKIILKISLIKKSDVNRKESF